MEKLKQIFINLNKVYKEIKIDNYFIIFIIYTIKIYFIKLF